MNALQRFENKLEELISGAFARTFRSAVQPVEIAAALNREADNSAQILSRDRRLIPNRYHVELSPTDLERLRAVGSLDQELVSMLQDHAAGQSYVFTGPVSVDLEESEELTTGRFRVRSKSEAGVSGAATAPSTDTEVHRAGAFLVLNGQNLPLTPPGILIGRANDADLRLDDPGVSRRHAEVRVIETATGPRVSLHDLGSTNGVLVNGKRVEQATLADGAAIRIGNTTLTLRLQRAVR